MCYRKAHNAMRLIDASLCCDCDTLVELPAMECPSCTNKVLLPLTRIIAPLADRREIDLTRTMQQAYVEYNPLTGIPKE